MGIWAGIKHALNSSLGTENFMPLDERMKVCASEVIDSCEAKVPVAAQSFSKGVSTTSLATVVSVSGKGYVTLWVSKAEDAHLTLEIDGNKIINEEYLEFAGFIEHSSSIQYANMAFRFNKAITVKVKAYEMGTNARGTVFFEE